MHFNTIYVSILFTLYVYCPSIVSLQFVLFVRLSLTVFGMAYRKYRGIKNRQKRGNQISLPKKKHLHPEGILFCTRTIFFSARTKKCHFLLRLKGQNDG